MWYTASGALVWLLMWAVFGTLDLIDSAARALASPPGQPSLRQELAVGLVALLALAVIGCWIAHSLHTGDRPW